MASLFPPDLAVALAFAASPLRWPTLQERGGSGSFPIEAVPLALDVSGPACGAWCWLTASRLFLALPCTWKHPGMELPWRPLRASFAASNPAGLPQQLQRLPCRGRALAMDVLGTQTGKRLPVYPYKAGPLHRLRRGALAGKSRVLPGRKRGVGRLRSTFSPWNKLKFLAVSFLIRSENVQKIRSSIAMASAFRLLKKQG